MKQECLVVAKPKRRRYGSYLGEISPAPENLLNRDFTAAAPNEKWLTDLSEFQIAAGKAYLSPMIDCFDGQVVSWSIGTRLDAELVNTMLDTAIGTIAGSSDRPVVHSDRGAHYRWPGWLSRSADAKLIRSMSRKGCSPDNAACEGFFGRLKSEMFYGASRQRVNSELKAMEREDVIRVERSCLVVRDHDALKRIVKEDVSSQSAPAFNSMVSRRGRATSAQREHSTVT